MKKIAVFLLPCILFFFTISHAQTINKWHQDGKIYFKIKDDQSVSIPSEGKKVDLDRVEFLQPLVQAYLIKKIEKTFYTADDAKLQKTYRLEFDNIYMVNELIRDLESNPLIEYAEPAPIFYTSYTPNDNYYVNNSLSLYGIFNANARWHLDVIHADQAWDISQGDTSIIVAVLDNAIWTDHPDLQNKIVMEIDLGDDDNDANPPAAEFIWSHGTHAAGLIAAESDNSVGVASIGFNVRLMAVKLAPDASGGQAMTAGFEGIVWAADNGADVISMSWGSPQFFVTMQNTVNYAYNKGCVLVAAAGNNGDGAETQIDPNIPVNYVGYPAALEHVIAVGSTDSDDAKSSFSEYGTWIDVCAPGGFSASSSMLFSVLSTTYSDAGDIASMLSGTGGGAASWGISGKYDCMQGTSMACPVAAGLAGLMLSVNPDLTPGELTAIMKVTCDNIDAQNPQFIDSIGAGRINAYAALLAVQDSMAVSPLTADFEASDVVIPEGGQVDYTDMSVGSPTSWLWTFDGGVPATSTDQNPLGIQYDTAGVYPVQLEISDGTNSDTELKTYFIIVGSSLSANGAWLPQSTGFTTQFRGILDVSIVDPLTVWAVTYDGTSGTMTRDFTRTTDGGNNWTPGVIDALVNHDVSNISAIDANTAWVAMYDANGGGGIYKTTDAGATWTQQTTASFSDASSFANVVHFFNASEGFCMGDPINNEFEIYTTSDGGANWTLVDGVNIPDPQSGEMGWTNVYYAVNDTAWFGTNTGRIYKTVDKGATWSVYTTGAANVSGISMNDALNGIMLAAVYDQTGQLTSWGMRKTNDGGETWASVTPGGPYYKSDMAAVPGIPGKIISTGISQDMAQCGSSYSFDYGATWTMLDDSIQYTMVEFFNDTTGWAGGFNLDENNEGIWKWLGIPVTNAPMFTSTPVTSVIVDSNYVYNITATDPAQNALTFDAPVLPSWLTLTPQTDSTAVLTGNPDSVDIGFHNVELSATNGNDTVHQNFVVEVITNVPFYVTAPTNSVIQAGQQYSFLVVADDYNGDTLTFGTNLLPGFLTITDHGNNTATVEGIPDTSCLGWNDVSITISDAMYTIEHTWKILVQPATGIAARLNADRMTVFPNPTKGEIIIILPEEVTGQDVEVSIINIAGEKLVCRKISGGAGPNRVSEDITSLSSGAYYLEIKTENGKYSEKIILQK